jgi:FMN reductase
MSTRPNSPTLRVVAVLASPSPTGSTAAAVHTMLEGCAEQGADVDTVHLTADSNDAALARIASADAIILASPTYRSTHTSLLGRFLELVERDPTNPDEASLTGKVTAVVMTGASSEHFLAPTALLQVLTCFFGAQVLSPPLYFDRGAFDTTGQMREPSAQLALEHGRALVDLTLACRASEHIGNLRPLV